MLSLALDVGSRRIGVAASDPTGLLARSVTVIHRSKLVTDLEHIARLVQSEGAEQVVVGLPLTLEGEVGPQAQETLYFMEQLRPVVSVPLVTWDERYTTVQAAAALRDQGVRARKQRNRIDATAAAVLLQHYLDTQRAQRTPEAPQ